MTKQYELLRIMAELAVEEMEEAKDVKSWERDRRERMVRLAALLEVPYHPTAQENGVPSDVYLIERLAQALRIG